MNSKISAWEIVENARSKSRAQSIDYIRNIFTDFMELKGDRIDSDDKTILGGLAMFENIPVTIIAFRKGKNLDENIKYNYGMAKPSGYRKALRLAKQAEKFKRPIIIFVDTPGAFPGVESEIKGQAEAIAKCLLDFSDLNIKIISIIISEACSGGALALCVSDRVIMLENSYFSILSPEGYASILWRNKNVKKAASMMELTSKDLLEKGIIDQIVKEENTTYGTSMNISALLKKEISDSVPNDLIKKRYEKLRFIDHRKKYE
ncbi:carboxyl transferase domain-containing protein [Paraclostridium bifermentans]|uniref:carboxyl transferase domain-containing protein n=1 Tax=Paraclostridium bifermentans TaxID=1490 RepID=UPI002914F89B|nr:carboxyl transferase domain-containing protein [Paraclostridium bifermentans]MDU3338017.1 carboxyl transferase domain-containing protein [Paraclostridium bifermentans]